MTQDACLPAQGGPEKPAVDPGDAGAWKRVAEALKALSALVPEDPPIRPPALRTVSFEELAEDVGRYRSGGEMTPRLRAYGAWRFELTRIEARNAGKLQCLAQLVLDLSDLQFKYSPNETLDKASKVFVEHFARRWRLDPTTDRSGYRLWAVKSTRRYDILPREWREL